MREEPVEAHDLRMDWDFDGVEFDEESKIRAETRKILELPDLPVSATCVRVPVLVGHAEAVWVETEEPLEAEEAEQLLADAPGLRFGARSPAARRRHGRWTRSSSAGSVVDSAAENGLTLFRSLRQPSRAAVPAQPVESVAGSAPRRPSVGSTDVKKQAFFATAGTPSEVSARPISRGGAGAGAG